MSDAPKRITAWGDQTTLGVVYKAGPRPMQNMVPFRATEYKALSRGNIEKLGTGKHRHHPGSRTWPYTIAGYTFHTKAEASRLTGLPYHRFTTLRPSHLRRRTPEGQLKLLLELERDVTLAMKGKGK